MEAIILFLSILIIFPDSAITALLCLVLLFVLLFIFLLSIGIEFFSFIYLIIYTGAILMLFLFILMFYNHKIVVSVHLKVTEFFLALFFLLGLINILFNLLFVGKLEDFNFDEYVSAKGEFLLLENNFYNNFIFLDDMKKFGVVLFNEYYFEFLLVGLLLLIIMIGVVGILLNFYEYFLFLNENKEKNKNL